MPQAKITQAGTLANGSAFGPTIGSQLDAKINSVVNLDNLNSGGELTYTWSILDQPPGAVDSLSSVSAQNPFFTPKKEGSYLIRLVVNQSLPTEQEDRVVLAVAQLKTRERMPAAGETTEADTSDGWATSMNSLLRRVDFLLSDPGILVGVNGSGGTLTRGQIVRAPGTDIIKATLPGAETVPSFTTVTATTLSTIDELLCVVEGTPFGLPGVPGTGSAENRLMRVRYIGRISALPIAGPAPTAGDVLFVNDAGAVSSIQGTIRRRIGSSMTTGSPADVWFNGVGGADIDLPSIAEPYVTNGPSALPNAFRIDGANAGARTAAMGPFEVHTGDLATPTTRWRRFSAGGASIGEWTTETGVPLVRVTATGQLVIEVGAGGLFVNAGGVNVAAGGGNVVFGAFGQGVAWPSNFISSSGANQLNFGMTSGATALISDVGGFVQLLMSAPSGGGTLLSLRNFGTYIELLNNANIPIDFSTNSSPRWRILGTGELVGINGTSIRTSSATSLKLGSNNADFWEVLPSGALSAFGTNRQVKNVAYPDIFTDATNAGWMRTLPPRNYVINHNMSFWQRATAGPGSTISLTTTRQFLADRFYSFIASGSGAATGYYWLDFFGLYYAGINRTSGVDTNVAARSIVYELDYDNYGATSITDGSVWALLFANNSLSIPLTLQWTRIFGAGATGSAVVKLVVGTGGRYDTGFAGASTIYTSPNQIPLANGTSTAVIPAGSIPGNTRRIAIVFEWTPTANPAVANESVNWTAVMLTVGINSEMIPIPNYAAGSFSGELLLCQRFYEKSTAPHLDPSLGGAWASGTVLNVLTGNLVSWPIGCHPRFRQVKRAVPVVQIWDAGGTPNQWQLDINRVTGASASLNGIILYNNTGGNVTPAASGYSVGSWAADAEI